MSTKPDKPDPLPCDRDVIDDEEFHELGLCTDNYGVCHCEEVRLRRLKYEEPEPA